MTLTFHLASKTSTIPEEFFKGLSKLRNGDDVPIFSNMPIFVIEVLALRAREGLFQSRINQN